MFVIVVPRRAVVFAHSAVLRRTVLGQDSGAGQQYG